MSIPHQSRGGFPNPDWIRSTLSQICNVVRGASPRPAGDPKYFNGNFMPWLTVAALTNIPDSQLVVVETAGKLTEVGAQFSRTLTAGTVIIANSGATLGVAKILGVTCCANDGIAALLDLRAEVEPRYVVHQINSHTDRLRKVVATGNGQPNLNTGLIGAIEIDLPCRAEQSAISDALDASNALIDALEQMLTKKRQIKQGAMQELLTGKRRLPGFSLPWKTYRLEEIADPFTRFNRETAALPVITCSKHLGFVDSLAFFRNQVFSNDTSTYKVVLRGQLAYPANHIEEGSIGYQDLYEEALVSPMAASNLKCNTLPPR